MHRPTASETREDPRPNGGGVASAAVVAAAAASGPSATAGSAPPFFAGGGEMGAIMRATDWSDTPLGPTERWPMSLRTMLGVVLGSRFPMLLWWGDDSLNLYNDAFRPIMRDKHPAALAKPARHVWAEIWGTIGPMVRAVLDGGPPLWMEDQQLFIRNRGILEETFFTYSYSAVPGDDGGIAGVVVSVQETTSKVQGERQIRLLHELAARAASARSERDAYRLMAEVLGDVEAELPFCMLYALDERGREAELVGSGGWPGYEGPARPRRIALDPVDSAGASSSWPLGEALRTERDVLVGELAERFGSLPVGSWGAAPERALILPLATAGTGAAPRALLIAGMSPHRALDERYRRALRAIADQVTSTLATVRAFQTEAGRAAALEELDRAKTTFFSNVSHELRTPLTLMLAPLEDAVAAGRELGGESLQLVARNARRLLKLVSALLDLSRIESSRLRAELEPCDLGSLTAELANAFRAAVTRAGLAFEVDCPPLAAPIAVDREQWEKIVLNLLSNALKFTFEGSIRVATRDLGDRVELTVRDTGTGIPARELPLLFERFHRVPGARSRTHEGTGIGLSLTRELVTLLGGQLDVTSALGEGTAFTITLPRRAEVAGEPRAGAASDAPAAQPGPAIRAFLAEAERWTGDAQRPAGPPPVGEAPVNPRGIRVLVVEDNPELRDYLAGLLGADYDVETAPDGVSALEAIARRLPTLVLSDVMMPRLDGFGLLRAIRADPMLNGLPVILLSARAGEDSTIEGLEAHADDYLVKPFSSRELLARVRAHAELARQREVAQRAILQAKETSEAAREAAELANRELESFSYSVAHDLRAPLRSIDGFSLALLEDYQDKLDAEGKAYLGYVRESAQRMAALIDDLLALSRVTRSELHREPMNLSAVARAALARLSNSQPERQVEVEVEDGLTDEGDERLLSVALENLLGNAWKFTAKRAPAHITFGSFQHYGRRTYFVRDDGAGFDMAFAHKLFGVFQRLHSASQFEGTGIGLATVQRVIRRHGGRVWAEAEVGRGATFYFTLHEREVAS
jgi:signal transduction histidine kinase